MTQSQKSQIFLMAGTPEEGLVLLLATRLCPTSMLGSYTHVITLIERIAGYFSG